MSTVCDAVTGIGVWVLTAEAVLSTSPSPSTAPVIDTVAINNRLLDIVGEAEALVGADRQGRNRADLTGGVRHGNG